MQHTQVNPTVGDAIRHLRTALGLSQQAFATKIDAALNSVARYEAGHNKPGQERLGRCLNLALEHGLTDAAEIFQRELMVDCYVAFEKVHQKLTYHLPATYDTIRELKATFPEGSLDPLQRGLFDRLLNIHEPAVMHEMALMGQKRHGDVDGTEE